MQGYIDEQGLCRAEITVIGGWQTAIIDYVEQTLEITQKEQPC